MKSFVVLLCVACSLAAPNFPGEWGKDGLEANYNTFRAQAIVPSMTAKLVDNLELAAEANSNLDASQQGNFQENLRSPTNKKIASPCLPWPSCWGK